MRRVDILFVMAYSGMLGLFLAYRICFALFYVDHCSISQLLEAAVRGWLFDTSAACALLLPLWVILLFSTFSVRWTSLWLRTAEIYYVSVWMAACIVSWGNLFYYRFFHTCINHTVWQWMLNGEMLIGMLVQDSVLCCALVGMGILCLLWGGLLFRIMHRPSMFRVSYGCGTYWGLAICLLLSLAGIGGRITVLDWNLLFMQVGDAYFCMNGDLNEAVHNPCYVLGRTTWDDAFSSAGVPLFDKVKIAPEVRVESDSIRTPFPNVVLIIMEGMQSSFVNDSLLAPFLYGLKQQACYFPNAYSAGRHTAHAVFSVLTGMPAPVRHPFFGKMPERYESSLPALLEGMGYSTLFMMPHDERFDNMKGFLLKNGFERVFSMKDYPAGQKANVFGVNDDYLLCVEALRILRAEASEGPFFCTLLTVSNHVPYVIPPYFQGNAEEKKYRVVQYADWALASFFQKASAEKWFPNTLFVLVGDHAREGDGSVCRHKAGHHVPIYFYAPSWVEPATRRALAGHVDIVPTVMGYIGISYIRHTYGIDLNRERRDFLLMTSDSGVEYTDGTMLYYYDSSDGMLKICCHPPSPSVKEPVDSLLSKLRAPMKNK